MAIQSITDSQAWLQFINAANAARNRNPVLHAAGSEAPQKNAPAQGFSGYLKQLQALKPAVAVDQAQDMARQPASKMAVGTRFDAYA